MKKFKKIIPALCMLLVSAVLLGTSTFAWFSINTTVNASNMNVTATTNTQYFVISSSTTFGTDVTLTTNTASTDSGINDDKATVYPVAYTTTGLTGAGASINPNSWYTANVGTYDGSDVTNRTAVTLEAGDYFLKYTFYVGLATNSTDFNGQLDVTAVTADTTNKGYVKAAVKVTGYASSSAESTTSETVVTNQTSAQTTTGSFYMSATSSKYLTVEVFVYVDGTHADVIDSATDLSGSVNVTVAAHNA